MKMRFARCATIWLIGCPPPQDKDQSPKSPAHEAMYNEVLHALDAQARWISLL